MGFSIGQVVTIKHDLKCGYHYDAYLTYVMQKYAGYSTQITGIPRGCSFQLKIDDGVFNWSPDMLEGYTGFYIGNHVLVDGIERVIVNSDYRDSEKRYQCDNGCWYTESELGRIAGFDYSNQTPPESLNVGDYVVVDINPIIRDYGGNSDWRCDTRSDRLMYNGSVGKITKIITGFHYVLDVDDSVYYSGYMLKKIGAKSPLAVGDAVLCNTGNNIGIIESIEGDTCSVSFKTNKVSLPTGSVIKLNARDIKLRQDVFGVGKSGNIITGYYSKDLNKYFVMSENFMSGELFDGEFTLA